MVYGGYSEALIMDIEPRWHLIVGHCKQCKITYDIAGVSAASQNGLYFKFELRCSRCKEESNWIASAAEIEQHMVAADVKETTGVASIAPAGSTMN